MNWVDANAFLSRVVAWPINQIGYVNLHYSMVNSRGGKDIVTGKPYQDINDLLSFCHWAETTNYIKELWYCTSLQSQTGRNSKGALKAVRLKQNVLALKAIWVDIDVKDDPNHYRNIKEAWDAICKFRADTKLPQFSAAVSSGGGLHIYWISKTPLDQATWQIYAEGLKALLQKHSIKCDLALTTDSARILRIPGTLNHKYSPPRPVELMELPARDYNFSTDLALLPTVAPAHPTTSQPTSAGFDNSALVGKTCVFPFDPTDTLSAGLEREGPPLDPKPIFSQCAFLGDAFMNGGKDYDNPLWNLSLLCATFMENGNGLAHEMSKGHAKYQFTETQEQYERKVSERKSRGLGYPSCATIKGSNCAACSSCPLYIKGKSPLNIRPTRQVTATVTAQQGQLLGPSDPDLKLPPGYCIGHDGTIHKIVEREATKLGEPQEPILLKLFYSKLSNPWCESDPDTIHFMTTVDKGNIAHSWVRQAEFGGRLLGDILNTRHVKYFVKSKHHLEEFFMAWLNVLHEAQAAQAAQPFGWMGPAGEHIGFCYGGTLFHVDGRETPSGITDKNMTEWYKPTGELRPWYNAHEMMMAIKRPEHAVIMAMAFAAPLMTSGGEYSGLLSAWSDDSGSQKSSALKVGLSVWGHPKKTKETEKSTSVSVLLKMGSIKSLPLYWDEISTDAAQKNVMRVLFAGTHGVEGGRGTTKITQQNRGDWQLAVCTCANLSFVDHIVREQPTTPAGVLRVLEFPVPEVPTDHPGMINVTDASRVLQHLEGNYGLMGLRYAKFLAVNYKRIDRETTDRIKKVGSDLHGHHSERFWLVLVGCLIQGATYANEIGASFDIEALSTFLYSVFQKNRERLASENIVGGSSSNTETLLTAYLKDRVDQMLWTNTFPTGQGRKRGVNILRPPTMQGGDAKKAVQIRWDVDDKMMRISKEDLTKWLKLRNIGISTVMRGLENTYKMALDKRVLSAGTSYKSGQENVIHINVPPGSALEDMLVMWSPPSDQPAAA